MYVCVGAIRTIGKQRALGLDIWPIPTIDSVIGKQRALGLDIWPIPTIDSVIGKQRALGLDIWSIPTISSVIGYSCVWTNVVARGISGLVTRFNTCPPYFKVECYTWLRGSMLHVHIYWTSLFGDQRLWWSGATGSLCEMHVGKYYNPLERLSILDTCFLLIGCARCYASHTDHWAPLTRLTRALSWYNRYREQLLKLSQYEIAMFYHSLFTYICSVCLNK